MANLRDLEYWDERIREKVGELGLDCFPQEFEECDHTQMLGYMAYSGMPSHYPHWSYGKSYEKLKTMYDYGVSGLPYEMVINSSPALAYLMRDNTLCLQILTMAHVYGHNDFFKNNFTFRYTQPERTINRFKIHADRVRGYIEDPSIGQEKVDGILDAAHAVAANCRRNMAIKTLTHEEQIKLALEDAEPPPDAFDKIHKRKEYKKPDVDKIPLQPEENILLFIREYNPFLEEWEKDLLTIVHEREQYFIPQIETKIMNEGWASLVHYTILQALHLPADLHTEFLVRHSQVVRPFPKGINPYHLGIELYNDILLRYGGKPTLEENKEYLAYLQSREEYKEPADRAEFNSPWEKLLQVRKADRDPSFLRQYLTREVMDKLHLIRYEQKDKDTVISHVSNDEGWKEVKNTLIQNIGMGQFPVIKIEDADYTKDRTLLMRHYHDGRDLQLEYAEQTLKHVYQLWRRNVLLETTVNGKRALLAYDDKGFAAKPLK